MRVSDFVITKTPLRVSFLGGGTDFEYFYKKYGGSVISAAINRYVYVTVKRHKDHFNENFRLNYSSSETVQKAKNIKNNIIRECIKITKINFPIYISTVADIPAGSGLGGSSSFTVGLLKALYAIQGKKITNEKLFNTACKIEIDILKEPIGKQDQLAAIYGGMKYYQFKKNNEILIKKINHSNKIFSNMKLCWMGSSRDASIILKDQKKNFIKNIEKLKKIKKISDIFYMQTKNKGIIDIKKLGTLIYESWEEKKRLSKKIQNNKANKIIKDSMNLNFYGAKLLGAGGSGFVLLVGNLMVLKNFKKKFKNIKLENLHLSKSGCKIVYMQ